MHLRNETDCSVASTMDDRMEEDGRRCLIQDTKEQTFFKTQFASFSPFPMFLTNYYR